MSIFCSIKFRLSLSRVNIIVLRNLNKRKYVEVAIEALSNEVPEVSEIIMIQKSGRETIIQK